MDEQVDLAVGRARSRATIAVVAIGLVCALHVVQLALVGDESLLLGRLLDHDLSVAEDLKSVGLSVQTVASFTSLGWFVSGVLFLRWVRAAHVAAARLGRGSEMVLRSPSSVVWAYFIPFVNFVRPLEDMSKLSWLSDPSDIELPPQREQVSTAGYRDAAVRAVPPTPWAPPKSFVGFWWASYILLSLSGIVVGLMKPSPSDIPGLITICHVIVADDVWFVVTGALCIFVVRGITSCQVERARRLAILAAPAV